MRIEMNKEFSEDFMNNMMDLLEMCVKNNTDNVDLLFDINGKKLNMHITFSVVQTDI